MRWTIACLALSGCASPPPPPAVADDCNCAAPTEIQARYDAFGRPLAEPRSTTVAVQARETVSLGEAGPPPTPRPRTRGRRDIQLHQARLDNALRMIAQEGGFNLIVESDLAAPVTVELRAVDPWDALVALAEAHGVAVRYENGIAIVGSSPERASMP
jgi:hypothetical protein